MIAAFVGLHPTLLRLSLSATPEPTRSQAGYRHYEPNPLHRLSFSFGRDSLLTGIGTDQIQSKTTHRAFFDQAWEHVCGVGWFAGCAAECERSRIQNIQDRRRHCRG